ncbi:MAG: M56 family metallopeptidase [Sphingobacteriales bacterium]
MPALFVFLLKVNVALLLFCAGYYLVLRHLTFYTLNRVYLVTAILFASLYPQINLSGFVQRHQQIVKPVQAVVFNWQAPAEKFAGRLARPNYWDYIEIIFWAGVVFLAMRLLVQLYSLYKLYNNSTAATIYGHNIRVLNGKTGPFSFWKSIYVNPENHEPADLRAILMHEQVHVKEWHTIDILLAELSTIFYWFNPGIWLIKKAVRENIEFITDQKILKNGADTKQYQYSLVSVSFASTSNTIVNHFNLSTIKKRIIMMNAKRSSKVNLTRYAFLVPAVVALLLVFSISKAALVSKHNNVFKTFASKIRTSNSTVDKSIAFVSKNGIPSVKNNLNIPNKPVTLKAADTIKKGNFFISTSHHNDSLNYVINGNKATKADFNALDSKHIASIEIMPAEQASKIFDQITNKNDVLFVTTNDSEAGKKFKEKIDKATGMDNVSYSIAAISKGKAAGGNNSVSVTSGDGDSASTSVTSTSAWSSNVNVTDVAPKHYKMKTIHLKAGKFKVDTFTIIKNGKQVTETFAGPDSDRVKMGKRVYTITSDDDVTTIEPKISFKKNKAYAKKAYMVIRSGSDDEASIEHLSEKMIMIDGKEATAHDMKKLSAADIESMNVKSGDEMTRKYGDKAKNGVLFISTKKAERK